jgi:hypothetical protein
LPPTPPKRTTLAYYYIYIIAIHPIWRIWKKTLGLFLLSNCTLLQGAWIGVLGVNHCSYFHLFVLLLKLQTLAWKVSKVKGWIVWDLWCWCWVKCESCFWIKLWWHIDEKSIVWRKVLGFRVCDDSCLSSNIFQYFFHSLSKLNNFVSLDTQIGGLFFAHQK